MNARAILIMSVSAALTACGGGGGGANSNGGDFVSAVRLTVASAPEDAEPSDVSNTNTGDEAQADAEPVAVP